MYFQEFNAKNPGLAINNDDILIECILGNDGYECKAFVDGALAFTQNFKFNGIAENTNGEMKYTVETSLAEVSVFHCQRSRAEGHSFDQKHQIIRGSRTEYEF